MNGVEVAAEKWSATLVILAAHPQHSMFRSHVEKMAQDLDVPVLLLREESEEEPH